MRSSRPLTSDLQRCAARWSGCHAFAAPREPDRTGRLAGPRKHATLAAAGLVPALRSYGVETERVKDWNQDLQDLGLDRLRRLVEGENVSDPAQAAAEITAEQSASPRELMPMVVPEVRAEATVEACPGQCLSSSLSEPKSMNCWAG